MPPPLDYAPRSQLPWRHRRGVRRTLVAGVLLTVLLAARWAAPPLWGRVKGQVILHRCAGFSAPANRVAFDADPARAAALTSADASYWNALNHELPPSPVASWAPPQWVALIGQIDPTLKTYRLSPPLLFMHERSSPTGARRVVMLRYAGTANAEAGPATHAFEYDVIDPSARPGPGNISTRSINLLVTANPFIRLWFGQGDARDRTHFSFQYETVDGKGYIDAWLLDAGTLRLEVRDGPEKFPG